MRSCPLGLARSLAIRAISGFGPMPALAAAQGKGEERVHAAWSAMVTPTASVDRPLCMCFSMQARGGGGG